MSTITTSDGKVRSVKNLGWLFRHWQTIERFEVRPGRNGNDFELTAIMRDGSKYTTDYASWQTSLNLFWFRSIFDGLQVWFYSCAPNATRRRDRHASIRTFASGPDGCNEVTQRYEIAYVANQYRNRRGEYMPDWCMSYLGPTE